MALAAIAGGSITLAGCQDSYDARIWKCLWPLWRPTPHWLSSSRLFGDEIAVRVPYKDEASKTPISSKGASSRAMPPAISISRS